MAATSALTIEDKGIAQVTAGESHGKPRALFGLWMAANIEFATLTTGALATGVFGLSGAQAFTAILIGNIIGGLILAAFATYGVHYGLPQMIQGTKWFGHTGNKLPSLLNCFGGFSWFGVNTIIGGYALTIVIHTPLIPNIIALCLIQVAIAFVGHDLIQTAEKYFFYLLVVIFLIFTIITIKSTGAFAPAQPKLLANVGGTSGAFILTTSVILSYVLGWIPYSSDYTRYMHGNPNETAIKKTAFSSVFLGSMVSCIWMEALGAIIGATVSFEKPADLLSTPWLPHWFQVPLVIAIIIGTISANIINIYSATLSALAVGLKLKQYQAAIVTGIIGTAISVAAATNFLSNYESFLFFLGYWTAPWAAIIFLGHTTKRTSRFTGPVTAGFLSWIIGILASIPFFNQYPLFVGFFAGAHPEFGDISFLIGAIVASIAYFALTTAPSAYAAAAE